MKGQMMKQKGFVRRLHKRLAARIVQRREQRVGVTPNEEASLSRIGALTEDDVDIIVSEFFEELGVVLRMGVRVIFEGWLSFFTKPVKRKCYNMTNGEQWMTTKRRIRTNVLDAFRDKAEVDISEAEYLASKQTKLKKIK